MSELWTPGLGPLRTLAKGVKWYKKLKQMTQLYHLKNTDTHQHLKRTNLEIEEKFVTRNIHTKQLSNKALHKRACADQMKVTVLCLRVLDPILCYHWCCGSWAVPEKSSDTHLGLWVPAFRSLIKKKYKTFVPFVFPAAHFLFFPTTPVQPGRYYY